jgi:peptidase E
MTKNMIKYCISDLKTVIENPIFSQSIKDKTSIGGIIIIPSTPENVTKTRVYGTEIIDIFKAKDINFNQVKYIDTLEDLSGISNSINDYSVIFLMGGRTKVQNAFFEHIQLGDVISHFKGIVIGQSAGALNMCRSTFLSPEHEESGEVEFLKGLGLVDFQIEVHFDIHNTLQKTFITSSIDDAYCISDNGAIIECEGQISIIGDVYQYAQGQFEKL